MQDTDLPEKIEPSSPNFQTELAQKIAELAPEVLSDGKLDVNKLRELVGGDAETSPEKFGLFWPGKQRAQSVAQLPTSATLLPTPEESVDWENTKNIFIEGDNLEALKVLQNSYRRKIKMIYIDPPYNTGKEFIYPDNFHEGLQSYLEYTGQKNALGEATESKRETGGRKHSNWLSMMYPRLQLAKSLLSNDGLIFISIDDNEQSYLKDICDEIFLESNYVGNFLWKKKSTTSNVEDAQMSSITDYTLCYRRSDEARIKPRITKKETRVYPHSDKEGNFRLAVIEKKDSGAYQRDTMKFPILGHLPRPGKRWQIGVDTARVLEDRGRFVYMDEKIKLKIYDFEDKDTFSAQSNLLFEHGTTESGAADVEKLFGVQELFDNPKPKELIEGLELIASDKDSIIMDFFSGSGTTAHATMLLNAKDGGNRRHIQIQLPEKTYEINVKGEMVAKKGNKVAFDLGYTTISDLSKERIRRASKGVKKDFAHIISQRKEPFDGGFRVYKLSASNFVEWDEKNAKKDIQQAVMDFAQNKKINAAPEALLAEIMLASRIDLGAKIAKYNLKNGNWVYVVDDGNLITYVAEGQITEAQASEIADLSPAKLVILDSSFNGNDALKINIANICKEKHIKEFKTI